MQTSTPTAPYIAFTDPVEDAVTLWNDGQASIFDFALKCTEVVGLRNGETARLAKRVRRDPSTIELYAKGGTLWLAMLERYPKEAEILRDALDVSFWNVTGQKLEAEIISLEQAKNFLEHAKDENWTVEKLRAYLPNKIAGESPFRRTIKKLISTFEKDILNAPALDSGMNEKEYKQFLKFAKAFIFMAKRFINE